MLDRFRAFVRGHDLFHDGHRLLVAVSGGVDSVALAHLLRRMDAPAGLAHVNFQLRGEESEEDMAFVRQLGKDLDYPVFATSCNTRELAREGGKSLQMAAREFRYAWLEELRLDQGFDLLVLGHHLQDSVETVLHHFARGTGLRGLHGIPRRNGRVIRPLLFATKKDILDYAEAEGLAFREDSSNAGVSYTRNRIRHELVPAFESVNPQFIQAAAGNIQRLQEAEYLMDQALASLRRELVNEEGERLIIDLEGLLGHYPAARTMLFEWLSPLGFNAGQVGQMLDSAGRQPGGRFYSESHRLLVDRDHLIVERRQPPPQVGPYFLNQESEAVYLPDGSLHLAWKEGRPGTFPPDPHLACLDLPPSSFPLRVRHWQPGDAFCPLGMDGQHQKLQDFFTHKKIPRTEKGRVWILETARQEICWVVGYRIDERFRITGQTDGYVRLQFMPSPE